MIRTEPTLAPTENLRLHHCEEIIARGLTTFVEVGRALMEIRDSKLYRVTHGTFEAYCKDRWDIVRSRAYELIDQAKVANAFSDAGVDLSAKTDISKRDVIALKADLLAATAEIKARVEQGQTPVEALAATIAVAHEQKEKLKEQKAAEQAKNDAARQQAQDELRPEIKAMEEAKQAAIAAAKAKKQEPVGLSDAERIAELEEQVRVLEADYAEVVAENKLYREMKALYAKGGFEAVIAAKDEALRVAGIRTASENRDKITWMNKAKWWREQAISLGWKGREHDEDQEDAA